jgi:phage tail-like protein
MGILIGDGLSSPVIHQIRLDIQHDSWLHFLPAIYSRDQHMQIYLDRMLSLFETMVGQLEDHIEHLPRIFDPFAVPDDGGNETWLEWLAGCLGFDIDERWDPDTRRHAVTKAFKLWSRRGTIQGLKEYLRFYLETPVFINELAQYFDPWTLSDPDKSVLGFTTTLAAAHPQGAVAGTTSVLRQSHLIDEQEYGAPLFEDLADRFCVHVYDFELKTPADEEHINAVVSREKPAHTQYHLCLIKSMMRVGLQAIVGIDTIVADSGFGFSLDNEGAAGYDTLLKEHPSLGKVDNKTGVNTRVGSRTILK